MEINQKAETARFRTRIGARLPAGATWSEEGTNFAVFSHDARNIELRLYERAESTEPFMKSMWAVIRGIHPPARNIRVPSLA